MRNRSRETPMTRMMVMDDGDDGDEDGDNGDDAKDDDDNGIDEPGMVMMMGGGDGVERGGGTPGTVRRKLRTSCRVIQSIQWWIGGVNVLPICIIRTRKERKHRQCGYRQKVAGRGAGGGRQCIVHV